jgi:carbonic anhydrase/acetyltransferase-like protein (isoleucine patch superfamily)
MSFSDTNTNTATLPPASNADAAVTLLKPDAVYPISIPGPADEQITPTVRKPRKKRAPKHDFKDGFGRVFAHRHSNGGGWVADTAHVGEDCYIGPKAGVTQYARVIKGVRIESKASVRGNAIVMKQTILRGFSIVQGTACVRDCVLENHAQISGDADVVGTNMYGRALVAGTAMVRNSNLRGRVVVGGNAVLIAVTANGWIEFNNNCNVLRSTLHGLASVSGHARVLDSAVNNYNWQACGVKLADYETLRFRADCFVIITESAILQDSTNIYSPVKICGASRLINNDITVREMALPPSARENPQNTNSNGNVFNRAVIMNKVWRGARTGSREELDRLLAADLNAPNSTTAVPQITRQHTQSPYSLERLSQGRRIVPV